MFAASSAMNGPEVSCPFVFFVSSKKNVNLFFVCGCHVMRPEKVFALLSSG